MPLLNSICKNFIHSNLLKTYRLHLDAKPSYKPSIKLSNELFREVQKNKSGSLTGVNGNFLRKEIEKSIQQTARTIRNIDKVKVAAKLVEKGFSVENKELNKKLEELVKDIKNANS